MTTRAQIITSARCWLRTPFVWEACVPGVGVDCGRFLAASFNGAGLTEIDMASLPRFQPDWFLHKREGSPSPFLEQIRGFGAVEYELPAGGIPQPADIVVAKLGRDWAHSALVIEWPHVIACANGFCVTEWRDLRRSPQYGSRPLKFFDPFAGRYAGAK
jgi:hypothetical protein